MKLLKDYYIRFILVPSKTIKLSLSYLYGRIILFLALKGIKMPGLEKIKKKLPKNMLDIFERQVLIYEIKGERFSFRLGPLWLRQAFEKIIFVFEKNKFMLLIILKTFFASIAILVPVASFVVIRGILPVPERVPYTSPTKELHHNSFYRTDWLYTESPFLKNTNLNFNFINFSKSRGVNITPVLEPDAPAGLNHFGIGYYPAHLNLIRGFLAGESSALIIQKQVDKIYGQNNKNRLRIQYYLFPSRNSKNYQCKIDIKDENNHVLISSQELTPDSNSLDEEIGISKSWHELFTPNYLPGSSKVKEFIIPLNTPPQKIIAVVTSLEKPQNEKKTSYNLTDDDCIFALGDFSFENIQSTPLKRRGIVFVLVDTLRADTAYDKKIMPNLNQFASENAVQFLEHRAQGNMTVPSITSLMTSLYARNVGSIAFTYAADAQTRKNFYATKTALLPTSLQNLGYRVGAIGWLSLFSEALQGGVDLGFHNSIISENSVYEARHITEKMGSWLEDYGDAPFFLYLHYNTMHGPYKPPFFNINFKAFLSKPFGLNQRKQLYNGLGRYWDDEFLNLIQKLKDLGIYDDVDIFITADHGAQFYNQPWDNLKGVDQGISGGYADKGHSLLDEEVRVPLIVRLANSPKLKESIISTPTAHLDLFPTIYNYAGGVSSQPHWKGINLESAFTDVNISFESILTKRKFIYFDAHKYAGLLYWGDGIQHSAKKYIRQFSSDDVRLYLTHNPWNININWYQPEIFTSVDFVNHNENWISIVPGNELKNLRKIYFQNSPSDKILRIIAKYSGTFQSSVTLDSPLTLSQNIVLLPKDIKVTQINDSYYFEGEVKKDEAIWINLGQSKLKEITFQNSITPIICQNGNFVDSNVIATLFENNVCPFFVPPNGIIESNYTSAQKPVVIQKSLSSERAEQLEGSGAGKALQQALKDWGYAR